MCVLYTGRGFPNVEDLENWHGKALGDLAATAVAACEGRIANMGPHGVSPKPIVDDAPKFDIPSIKLSTPPNYKLGDKVQSMCYHAPLIMPCVCVCVSSCPSYHALCVCPLLSCLVSSCPSYHLVMPYVCVSSCPSYHLVMLCV